MSEKETSKWWEFYGIRYAQGTVVGAMLVYFLFSKNEQLKKILLLPSDPKDFGMAHLTLLAIYGLTYCYIASAPVLVMHAGRGLLYESPTNPKPNNGTLIRTASLYTLPLLLSIYFYFNNVKDDAIEAIALIIFTSVLNYQAILLVRIFHFSWEKTINYYTAIINKRSKPKQSGYVESYKHIREHGNSFLIVLFELILAIPIYVFVSQAHITSEEAILNLSFGTILWVFPAALIWYFGNKLESHMQVM